MSVSEYDSLKKLRIKIVENKDIIVNINSSSDSKYLIGAVCLDRGGNVISYGFNSYSKTHPLQYHYAQKTQKKERIFLHAEIAAIIRARRKIDTLIIARIMYKSLRYGLSKPCPICTLAIMEAGIKNVYFTNSYGELVLLDI